MQLLSTPVTQFDFRKPKGPMVRLYLGPRPQHKLCNVEHRGPRNAEQRNKQQVQVRYPRLIVTLQAVLRCSACDESWTNTPHLLCAFHFGKGTKSPGGLRTGVNFRREKNTAAACTCSLGPPKAFSLPSPCQLPTAKGCRRADSSQK